MPKQPFNLMRPRERTTSVIFASPHSGRDYPWGFLRRSILDERTIRTSEDAFVDILFEDVPQYGAPLLSATAPRAYLDLNRSAEELDAALIDGVGKMVHNPRVASGLGVVPRVVASGRAIYRGKMTLKEAHDRIATVWRPYHDMLQTLLNENLNDFGEAILVDCHSMPHEAIATLHQRGMPITDVVLGDRFGAAASSAIVDRIEAAFLAAGLKVTRNAPFAGAYVTQHYGRPSRKQHAVQIEIDRSLYMNEQLIRPNGNFMAFRKLISQIASEISEIGRTQQSLAAE